jgi:O-antigen/teichoic acid export membrane protein
LNSKTILQFSIGPIGAAALGLITLPIVAWYFSPEDIGRLAMLQVTVSFTLLLFSLGLDQAYVREYYEVHDKPGLLKAVFVPGLQILVVVIAVLMLSPWKLSLLIFGKESLLLSTLLYGAIILSFGSRFFSLILRMKERGLAFSMSQLLPKLLFLLIIMGYVLLGADADFDNLIMANFWSLFAVFVVYAWNTRNDWLPSLTATIDRAKQYQMIRYAIPLIGSGLAFWGLTAMDKVFLRSLSSFEEVGIYSVAVSFAGAALVFKGIFATVWTPMVYKWAAEDEDPQKIKDVIDYVTLFVVVIWSLTGMFSWVLIYILPPEYDSVQYIIVAVMAYPLLWTLSQASSVGIGVSRKTTFALLAAVIALGINLVSNPLLIPMYGASGAAIATVLAFLVFFIIRTESSSVIWIRFDHIKMYLFIFLLSGLSVVVNIILFNTILISIAYTTILIFAIAFYRKQSISIFLYLKHNPIR